MTDWHTDRHRQSGNRQADRGREGVWQGVRDFRNKEGGVGATQTETTRDKVGEYEG